MWILILILKECLKKLIMKRVSVDNKSMKNYPACNKLKNDFVNVISTIIVNSEIFARVLFSRKFAYAKFLEKNSRDTGRSLCRLLIYVNHALVLNFNIANMSFNANPEIKILAKISEFTVISRTGPIDLQFSTIFVLISTWILVLSRESKTIIQISSACFIKKVI